MKPPRRRGPGEGSVYHRASDGLWIAAITLPSGRRRTRSAHSRREAVDKLDQLRTQRAAYRPQSHAGANPTLRTYLQRWLTDVASLTVRESTLIGYESMVLRVSETIGSIRLHDLEPADIQHCYRLLAPIYRPSSLRTRHAGLRSALQHAVATGLIPSNPADHATLPQVPHREMTTLDDDQLRSLILAAPDQLYRCLWTLLGTTGLRVGEALALTWPRTNLAAGTIHVTHTLHYRRRVGFELADVKSARSRRLVHLGPTVAAEIRARRVQQNIDRLAHALLWPEQLGDLIFTLPDGRPIQTGSVEKRLHLDLAAARLPRIRVHDLRHTAASIALRHGVSPKLVSEMLGHSSVQITLDTYSHTTPAMHDSLAQLMDTIVSPATSLRLWSEATDEATETARRSS